MEVEKQENLVECESEKEKDGRRYRQIQRRVSDFAPTSIVWWCLVSAGSLTHKEFSQSAYNEICLEQHKLMHSILSHTEYAPSLNMPAVCYHRYDCLNTSYSFITELINDMNVLQYWHKRLFKTLLDNIFHFKMLHGGMDTVDK